MKKGARKKFILGTTLMIILSRVIIVAGTFVRLRSVKKSYTKRILFSGQEMSFNGLTYEGQSLAVAFSGIIIDLRGATIKESATIDLYGEYCGVKIIVPKKWRVNISGQSKMSGISNSIKYKKDDKNRPLLIIKHDLRYAGLELTNQDCDCKVEKSDLKSSDKNFKKNKCC